MRTARQGTSGCARVPLALDYAGSVCSAGRVCPAARAVCSAPSPIATETMKLALDRARSVVQRARTRCVRRCALTERRCVQRRAASALVALGTAPVRHEVPGYLST